MGMLKKVAIILVLISSVVLASIVLLPGGFGKVGFSGGTAYLTTTVVGVNGERIVLEKQAPLTQSIVYEGIEVESFEYAVEIEFAGSVDVEIAPSTVRLRLNCDVSCIMAEEWGITPMTVGPGERHELVQVSISAADIELIAPADIAFELKFILELQWRPVGAPEFKFLDITHPIMKLQTSAPDIVIPPPTPPDDPVIDPPDDPVDPPVAPPGGGGGGGGGYYILSIDPVPRVEER